MFGSPLWRWRNALIAVGSMHVQPKLAPNCMPNGRALEIRPLLRRVLGEKKEAPEKRRGPLAGNRICSSHRPRTGILGMPRDSSRQAVGPQNAT